MGQTIEFGLKGSYLYAGVIGRKYGQESLSHRGHNLIERFGRMRFRILVE
jgi:hypothetical protein